MAWNDETKIQCRFELICPQQWSKLQPTEQDDMRHCAECNRDVHLALSETDMRRHSEQGRCIAVPVAQPKEDADPDEPCWVVGMMATPYDTEKEE